MLAQEARTLLQLAQADQRGENIQDKARQLKVWSNKTALYQKAIKRLRCSELEQVLVLCAQLDMGIKTGQRKPVWQLLELIVVTLCTGKGLGHVL